MDTTLRLALLCLSLHGLAILTLAQAASTGQAPTPSELSLDHEIEPTEASPVPPAKDKSGNEWVFAPIPKRTPSQGWSLQLMSQYIFKPKKSAETTPPSILGLTGFYTEEKSWGAIAGYLGHLKDDLWRPALVAGRVHLNDRFYGIGNDTAENDVSVPIEEDFHFAMAQMLRKIHPNLYAGLRLSASKVEVSTPEFDEPNITLPPFQREASTYAFGPILQWDSRNDQFYPTSGMLVNANALFYEGDQAYQRYNASWNAYFGLDDKTVLATRLALEAVKGDAPFYALANFGQHNDLRGYRKGKYRDNNLIAIQGEYRRMFNDKWGGVLFAGIGEVIPSFSELNGDDLLPSAGIGLRYRLAKDHPVNFRLDWAYGKDGGTFYLGVREAF